MINICVRLSEADLRWFQDTVAELGIREDWLDCDLRSIARATEATEKIAACSVADVIVSDLSQKGGLAFLQQARSLNSTALIVPLVTAAIPPSDYVRPEILPFCLFWQPIHSSENRKMLLKVLAQVHTLNAAADEHVLALKGKRESRHIPYGKILFFEAREKKVYVRLQEQEIAMNDTLAGLEERVPASFFRCHKGFLVNGDMVQMVDWTNQMIILQNQLVVPVSRSYRAKVKERINGVV